MVTGSQVHINRSILNERLFTTLILDLRQTKNKLLGNKYVYHAKGMSDIQFPSELSIDNLIFTVLNSFTEQCSGEWNQDGATHQLKNSSLGTIGIIYELYPFLLLSIPLYYLYILSMYFLFTCQTGEAGPKSWDSSTVHDLYSPGLQFNKSLHGFSINDSHKLSSPIIIESTNKRNNQAAPGEPRGSLGHANIGRGLQTFHPHSLPECHDGVYNTSKSMALSARNASFRLMEGGHHNNHDISSSLHCHSSDQNEGKTSIKLLVILSFCTFV
jgi:hypothetical protein